MTERKIIGLKYKNKKFNFVVEKCNRFERARGLMFKTKGKAMPLLFEFDKLTDVALTSFFVFFPFIVIWLDDKNEIIEIRKIQPFKFLISSKKPFKKIIEIPMNQNHREIIELLSREISLF